MPVPSLTENNVLRTLEGNVVVDAAGLDLENHSCESGLDSGGFVVVGELLDLSEEERFWLLGCDSQHCKSSALNQNYSISSS